MGLHLCFYRKCKLLIFNTHLCMACILCELSCLLTLEIEGWLVPVKGDAIVPLLLEYENTKARSLRIMRLSFTTRM